jgi:hypothetical protein
MSAGGTPTTVTPVDATTETAEPKPDFQQLATETNGTYVISYTSNLSKVASLLEFLRHSQRVVS